MLHPILHNLGRETQGYRIWTHALNSRVTKARGTRAGSEECACDLQPIVSQLRRKRNGGPFGKSDSLQAGL